MNKVWQCKDGRKIKVEDMTISHIENTVKMLKEKSIPYWQTMLDACAEAPDLIGSYEMYTISNVLEKAQNWVKIFEEELKRRKNESICDQE